MKRILTLLFLLFISLSIHAQKVISPAEAGFSKGTIYDKPVRIDGTLFTGIIQESYKNGLPKFWINIKDGRAEGEWIEWYPNGNYRFKSFWKEGAGHGQWQYFYESGQLRSEDFVIKDIYNGPARSYFENGQLQQESFYINNQKIGYESSYSATGSLINVNRYEDGLLLNDRPRKFAPGIISTSEYNEWNITFSPDGKNAFFDRRMKDKKQKIYTSTLQEGKWSKPALSDIALDRDEAPFFSKANNCFYFATTHKEKGNQSPVKSDMNIWSKSMDGEYTRMKFNVDMQKSDQWPTNYETGPVTDEAGNIYFWSGGKEGNGADIFVSLKSKGFKTTEPLSDKINTTKYESSPVISPDGKYLLFSSYGRDDGLGEEDIYYSKKVNGEWTKAQSLGSLINTKYNESCGSFSPDGKQFFFSSDREGNGNWSIYFLDCNYLGLE